MSAKQKKIIVIGGGILGVSTAAALAKRSASVTLVTEEAIASGASGRSLSWLNAFLPTSPAYHELRVAALARYREFARTHDTSTYLHFDGGIYWKPTGTTGGAEHYEYLKRLNYPVELLTPEKAQEKGLGLSADVRPAEGIFFAPEEGWVDLPSLIAELLLEFTQDGGKVIENAGHCSVIIEDGQATGVQTGTGHRMDADAVVVATGPSVPSTVAETGFTIPEATPISVLVRTQPVNVKLKAVINSPNIAVRPNLDGTLVLDHSWAEAEVIHHDDGTYTVPDETIARLLAEASAVLEGNPELKLESYGMGPKPIPGDGLAVAGELPGVQNYFLVFTHSGATLGLILGDLLAAEVLGEQSELLSEFRPHRFSVQDAPLPR